MKRQEETRAHQYSAGKCAVMSKRVKERGNPRKMSDFFPVVEQGKNQDGRGAAGGSVEAVLSSGYHSEMEVSGVEGVRAPADKAGDGQHSPLDSPTTRSPCKSKRQKGSEGPGDSISHHAPLPLLLPATPEAADQPLTAASMRSMIVALHAAIQQDLAQSVSHLSLSVTEVTQRVSHIEDRMREVSTHHNDMVDCFASHTEELRWIKSKLADMEDRSRRNNIKFRGIPEAVQNADLMAYLICLMVELLPGTKKFELIIDRAHRIPKPSFLPAQVPRDVLARIHFYHVKEKAMMAARANPPLSAEFAGVSLYTDLSQATLSNRRLLSPLIRAFKKHRILYKWGFPVKLRVWKGDRTYVIASVEAGLDLLKKWGLENDLQEFEEPRRFERRQDMVT